MRYLLAGLLALGCGAPPKPLTEIETVPTNAVEEPKPTGGITGKPGARSFEGFPLPQDTEDHGPGARGSHKFAVMRARDAVHDELIPRLRADGWRIKYLGEDGRSKVDEKALLMNGYAFYAAKGDKIYFVNITKVVLADKQEVTGMSITTKPVTEKNEPMKPADI